MNDIKFLGCLTPSQTHTLYSIILFSISLFTLSKLPESMSSLLFEQEEEDDLLNSRTVLELSIILARLLSQSALISSLISLIGTFLTQQARLQLPLKLQAIVNLLISSFGMIVLGTIYLSPTLTSSASHELCQFALRSDSLASLSRTPDYHSLLPSMTSHYSLASPSTFAALLWPTPSTIVGENCDERAATFVLPSLIALALCHLFHLHLLHVLLSPSALSPSPLLPIHRPSPPSPLVQPIPEKNLILL